MATNGIVAAIEAADDRQITEVPMPEWGTSVYVRTIPGDAGAEMADAVEEAKKGPIGKRADFYAFLAYGLCDASGARLFASIDEAYAFLIKRAQKVVVRLQQKILEVNSYPEGKA